MEADMIIFWSFIGLYWFCVLLRLFISRCCVSRTRIIIRDDNGNIEYRRIESNVHIIILTNDNNNELEISEENEDDIENQIPKCPICQDVLNINIVKTECGHKYHKSCLITWISSLNQRQHLKCPVCVQSLSL